MDDAAVLVAIVNGEVITIYLIINIYKIIYARLVMTDIVCCLKSLSTLNAASFWLIDRQYYTH